MGAWWCDVLIQFLSEAMFLRGLGGALGIAHGAALAVEAPHIPAIASSTFPPPVVSIPSVLLAFGVSIGIGLFFGIYTAHLSARLQPSETLANTEMNEIDLDLFDCPNRSCRVTVRL